MSRRRTALLALTAIAAVTAASAQQPTVGLMVNDPRAYAGYTLFSPVRATTTYLIDIDARPVHSWQATLQPGLMAYLLEDGHLLRAASLAPNVDPRWSTGAGGGGRIEEYDWDGNLVWSFDYSSDVVLQHHDVTRLPSGNVVFIAWEWKSRQEAIDAGRNPLLTAVDGFWPDTIVEVRPTGPTTGDIVWEWHVWDHLIQDFDASKANFGVVGDHPELLDVNAVTDDGQRDFNHLNGIAYNVELDQIVLSSRSFNELWIIDHDTTTAEAAGHSGGRRGMGGDLLYRWGNPVQYDRGTTADRALFNQHDAQWIPSDRQGAGNLLVFNNGFRRPDGNYSSVEELVPPLDAGGTYDIVPGEPFGPAAPLWRYTATPRGSFLAPIISGAQRQPNGNTLICEGTEGHIFEVTSAFETVWSWISPVLAMRIANQGDTIPVGFGAENSIFKARRYPPDYPGLAGRPLVPGEVLESFVAPPPVPDGRLGTSPIRGTKVDSAGTRVDVTWDAFTCPAPDYNLLFGRLDDAPTTTLMGAECALGTGGLHAWSGVPAGDLFFLLVGVGDYAMYESGWGTDSTGRERSGTHASQQCGATTKSTRLTCP
jgi:hypothetical protein